MMTPTIYKNNTFKNYIIEITAAIFILLFVYTAVSKFMNIQKFQVSLQSSPVLSFAPEIISVAIPVIEIVIASLLFFPATRKWGFISSLILMTGFTFYIAYMLLFSPKLPCSCGGIVGELSWRQHLFVNLILTSLAATAVFIQTKFFIAINRTSRKPVNRVGANF